MQRDISTELSAARGGDRDAFAEAYAAAYDELRRLARRQLRALRISLVGIGTREQTLALARRIVPRIQP